MSKDIDPNDQNVILFRLDSIEIKVAEQGKMLTEVRDHVMKTHLCPKPGLCLDLNTYCADFSQRLARLEKREAWIIGAATTASVIAAALVKMM